MTTETIESRLARLERSNARLRVGIAAVVALGTGLALGGFQLRTNQPERSRPSLTEDPVTHYFSSDERVYRVRESGMMEYIRLEDNPPRSADGVFGWGTIRIDPDRNLLDYP